LVDTYDKDHKISNGKFPEKYTEIQWLSFQISGQGPYYGQAAWFSFFHHEKIPSAIERYRKEVKRVIGVLDSSLAGKKALVGDKVTYADLAFITWGSMVPWVMGEEKFDVASEYPSYNEWMEGLLARPAVKKVLEEKANMSAKH
jgi:glutathione S-transferase